MFIEKLDGGKAPTHKNENSLHNTSPSLQDNYFFVHSSFVLIFLLYHVAYNVFDCICFDFPFILRGNLRLHLLVGLVSDPQQSHSFRVLSTETVPFDS